MFRRKKKLALQMPAIIAGELMEVLIAKGILDRGEAAASLRGIANHVVARHIGREARPYAEAIIEEADRLAGSMPRFPSRSGG